MTSISSSNSEAARRRRLSTVAIKQSLRELGIQLSLLNHEVSAHLELKDGDLDCLNFIASHGPLSPSALARRTGLHPATITGILDRLERGGWLARERDLADRRAIVIRALRDRNTEMLRLYAGMNASMDQICADFGEPELELIVNFLRRTADAGRSAAEELGGE